MANVATLSSAQSSSLGPFAEFTTNSNINVANGTSPTTATVGIPTQGSGSLFNPNLPLSVTCLNQSSIQGASNSGIPAGLGLTSCVLTNSTTITLTFVNNAAGSININTNTRFLIVQNQGI